MTLNKEQKQVVEKIKGACVVLAGAGTGKSHTIIEKIDNLVKSKEFQPEEILALTFSNEATNSLKNKVMSKLQSLRLPTIRTFHGFCLDILKEDAHLINLDNEFEILLPDDAKVLMHRELGITPYWASRYVSTISTAKDFGIDISQIEEFLNTIKDKLKEHTDLENLETYAKEQEFILNTIHLDENTKENRQTKKEIKQFLEIYKEYNSFNKFVNAWKDYDKIKLEKKYIDYSDLNHYVLLLFRKFGAEKYTDKFKYVIIDEFQDTNKIQFELIEYIASEHKNITVVGDPNQSIYGFRGSYKESFNHFKKVYDATKDDEINLVESWRSSDNILNVSHDLIKNNYENHEDCFKTKNAENRTGDKVKVIETLNKDEEARVIADLVEEKLKQGIPANEICVLFRTHRQGDYLKEYLKQRNIPVAQAGKTNLLNKREIKTTVSYLSMLNNLTNRTSTGDQSWWNLFHYKNLLSMEDSLKIGRYLKSNKDMSIDEALLHAIDKLSLNKNSEIIIKSIIDKVRLLHEKSNLPLEELVLEIYEITGLNRAFTYKRTPQNIESLMNMKKFYDVVKSFREFHGDDLNNLIDYMEVLRELGVSISASEIQNDNAIRFMTVHASKGLEYEVVIVSNMAESRFPVTRTQNEPLIPKSLLPDLKIYLEEKGELTDKEREKAIKEYEKEMLLIEERRLAYVAMTRAKNELILTFARDYKGSTDSNSESIFLNEIGYQDWRTQVKVEHDMIEYILDEQELNTAIAPTGQKDKLLDSIKIQIIEALDSDNNEMILDLISQYKSVKTEEVINLNNLPNEELEKLILKAKEGFSGLKFDKSMVTLSPTALIDYKECPKKYELTRILQMPSKNDLDDTADAASFGSFVHQVLEDGVCKKFKTEEEFQDYAKELVKKDEWKNMPIEDSVNLISIFWERNKDKINDKSVTEIALPLEIEGFKFFGLADRVDEFEDGTLEIIDYKTNKSAIDAKKRAYQLGYYALACREGLKKEPKKLTLEMLKLEKPVEFTVNGDEVEAPGNTKGFKISEIKQEFIDIANSIASDFESEFNIAKDDTPCRFCGVKFYCPKWNEE